MKLKELHALERYFHEIRVVSSTSEAPAALSDERTFVIVERGMPRVAMFPCPCGCGDVITLNLDRRVGPAWRLFRHKNEVSLRPSIWREDGCQSHFIVWRNRVLYATSPRHQRLRKRP